MLQGQSTIVNEIHPIIDNIMFFLYPTGGTLCLPIFAGEKNNTKFCKNIRVKIIRVNDVFIIKHFPIFLHSLAKLNDFCIIGHGN